MPANTSSTPKKKVGGQFGHPRHGGRVAGTPNKKNKLAREIAEAMGVDPVEFMLDLLRKDVVEVIAVDEFGNVILDGSGQPVTTKIAVTLAMKLDAAKSVAPYLHARLQATQVTGKDEGPVEMVLPTADILKDPKISSALADLALLVASGDRDQAAVN